MSLKNTIQAALFLLPNIRMPLNKTTQISLFIGMIFMLIAPMAATASVRLSIKQNQGQVNTSFALIVEYTGWLGNDPFNLSGDKDTVSFNGIYRTNTRDGAGTDFAWMIDPKMPGIIDIVEIRYLTVNGITTFTGFFKSFGGKVNLTPLPQEFGHIRTQPILPGGLTINATPPPVPEPEEYALMLLGFGMVGYQVKRKQKQLAL